MNLRFSSNSHPWMDGKAVSQWHGGHIQSTCGRSFERYASRQKSADKLSPKSYLLEETYLLKEKNISS